VTVSFADVAFGRHEVRIQRAVFDVSVSGTALVTRTTPAHERNGCRFPEDRVTIGTDFSSGRPARIFVTRRGSGLVRYRGGPLGHVVAETNAFGPSDLVVECTRDPNRPGPAPSGGHIHRDWVRGLSRPLSIRFDVTAPGKIVLRESGLRASSCGEPVEMSAIEGSLSERRLFNPRAKVVVARAQLRRESVSAEGVRCEERLAWELTFRRVNT